jgi:hypothetical protein
MNTPAPPIDVAKLPRLPRVRSKKDSRVLEVTLPVATAAFLITVSIIVFLAMQRHVRYAEVREDWEDEFGAHRFSYKDLYCATEGFKDRHCNTRKFHHNKILLATWLSFIFLRI